MWRRADKTSCRGSRITAVFGAAIVVSLLMEGAASWAVYDAGDYQSAAEEWRALAEAGDHEAQVALAGLYMSGQGVRIDLVSAIHWYRIAAEAGHPVAQLNLGEIYDRGVGLSRDRVKAYFWLTLSARQGRDWAEARRRELAREMTATELEAARDRLTRKRP